MIRKEKLTPRDLLGMALAQLTGWKPGRHSLKRKAWRRRKARLQQQRASRRRNR